MLQNGVRHLQLAVALILAGFSSLHAQQASSSAVREVPLFITVEPVDGSVAAVKNPLETLTTVPGHAVTIRGVAPLEVAGKPVRITVTPPQKMSEPPGPEAESECEDPPAKLVAQGRIKPEPPVTLTATITKSGAFETKYVPKVPGEYEVVASAGKYEGEATFQAENPELEQCEIPEQEIVAEAKELSRKVCKIVDVIRKKIEALPSSPAKEEFRRKLQEFEKELQKKPACGDPPDWAAAIGAINAIQKKAPHARPATRKIRRQFKTWLETARRANQEEVLSHLESGNVVCDQLDIIINGLKFATFFMGLAAAPKEFFLGFLKETTPTSLIGMAPPLKRSPVAQQTIESSWAAFLNLAGKEGDELKMGRFKVATDLVNFAFARIFEVFCQQFTGPVSGTMYAEGKEHGKVWWKYRVEIQGTLVLRYPKNAQGPLIALTGEFFGNATSLRSWDNAIPILFPGLTHGTIFKSWRVEPVGIKDVPLLTNPLQDVKVAGLDVPDLNPISATIEKGGLIAKLIFTPAFFRVPVRGDLRQDKVVVELQPATVDFDGQTVSVYHLMLPVFSMRPQLVNYELPYKGAHFILFRAMNDGPVEFKLDEGRNVMSIERKFSREKDAPLARGTYSLSVRACNPGCDIPQPPRKEEPITREP